MASKTLTAKIKQRIDTTENWTTNSTAVLENGELGLERTSNGEIKIKVGDGVHTWAQLSYVSTGGSSATSEKLKIKKQVVYWDTPIENYELDDSHESINYDLYNYIVSTDKEIGDKFEINKNYIYNDYLLTYEQLPLPEGAPQDAILNGWAYNINTSVFPYEKINPNEDCFIIQTVSVPSMSAYMVQVSTTSTDLPTSWTIFEVEEVEELIIDDIPTKDSDNFVLSKGIFDSLPNIREFIQQIDITQNIYQYNDAGDPLPFSCYMGTLSLTETEFNTLHSKLLGYNNIIINEKPVNYINLLDTMDVESWYYNIDASTWSILNTDELAFAFNLGTNSSGNSFLQFVVPSTAYDEANGIDNRPLTWTIEGIRKLDIVLLNDTDNSIILKKDINKFLPTIKKPIYSITLNYDSSVSGTAISSQGEEINTKTAYKTISENIYNKIMSASNIMINNFILTSNKNNPGLYFFNCHVINNNLQIESSNQPFLAFGCYADSSTYHIILITAKEYINDFTDITIYGCEPFDNLSADNFIEITDDNIIRSTITPSNKLSADLIADGTTNKTVTETEKSNWNSKTSNIGTITGITMNGTSKGTSGIVDLGTVITSHQDISGKENTSNKSDSYTSSSSTTYASTKALVDGLATKQATISDLATIRSGASAGATAIQSIKTINNESILGTGNISFAEGAIVVSDTEPVDSNVSIWIDTSAEGVLESIIRKKTWNTKAHRGNVTGYSATLKENTLGAYHNAYKMGADMIEVDARLSSDGIFMCNHDATVTDSSNNTYTISSTTAAALQALTLSTDTTYGSQGVPTLEAVLNLAYNYGLRVDIDLKMNDNGYTNAQKQSFAQNVAKLVAKCGLKGKATYAITGNGALIIPEIIAIDPEAYFVATKSQLDAITNLASILPNYKAKCYAYTDDFTQSNIDAIRNAGYMLELISITASNFNSAIAHHPENLEYLHTTNFRTVEDNYFDNLVLY